MARRTRTWADLNSDDSNSSSGFLFPGDARLHSSLLNAEESTLGPLPGRAIRIEENTVGSLPGRFDAMMPDDSTSAVREAPRSPTGSRVWRTPSPPVGRTARTGSGDCIFGPPQTSDPPGAVPPVFVAAAHLAPGVLGSLGEPMLGSVEWTPFPRSGYKRKAQNKIQRKGRRSEESASTATGASTPRPRGRAESVMSEETPRSTAASVTSTLTADRGAREKLRRKSPASRLSARKTFVTNQLGLAGPEGGLAGTEDEWKDRGLKRQIKVAQFKSSAAYANYTGSVERSKRAKTDPSTPDHRSREISRKGFDARMIVWREFIHRSNGAVDETSDAPPVLASLQFDD